MSLQTVFKRYELKYVVTPQQKQAVMQAINEYMVPDKHGATTIRNIYFDTDTYLLIRRSIEKPEYKEKLRVRSYGPVNNEDTVFVELKKKYKSVVYKRRMALKEKEAMDWLLKGGSLNEKSQVASEIEYFLQFYENLHPTVFLSYDREAYHSKDNKGFRVTFDSNILARVDELSLKSRIYGTPILPKDKVLMEIKCSGGIPLWMTNILSKEKIFKTSFSKYGKAYKSMIYPQKLSTMKVEKGV